MDNWRACISMCNLAENQISPELRPYIENITKIEKHVLQNETVRNLAHLKI